MDALLAHPKSAVLDATILALVLKITRLRTAGYETALLLAQSFGADRLANLLGALCIQDREADDRAAGILAAMICSGGEDWDTSFRLSQGA